MLRNTHDYIPIIMEFFPRVWRGGGGEVGDQYYTVQMAEFVFNGNILLCVN